MLVKLAYGASRCREKNNTTNLSCFYSCNTNQTRVKKALPSLAYLHSLHTCAFNGKVKPKIA